MKEMTTMASSFKPLTPASMSSSANSGTTGTSNSGPSGASGTSNSGPSSTTGESD